MPHLPGIERRNRAIKEGTSKRAHSRDFASCKKHAASAEMRAPLSCCNWLLPLVFAVDTFTNYSSSNHNGFSPSPESEFAYQWNSPKFEAAVDSWNPLIIHQFRRLREYADATGQEVNYE
jgi:hypothetical protein